MVPIQAFNSLAPAEETAKFLRTMGGVPLIEPRENKYVVLISSEDAVKTLVYLLGNQI